MPAVFVHGHTHLPDRGQATRITLAAGHLTIPRQGFSPVRGALTPVVINGGAWQRTITPVQFDRVRRRNAACPEPPCCARCSPSDLAPCYSFVHVAAVHRRAVAKRSLLAAGGGRQLVDRGRLRGELAESCGGSGSTRRRGETEGTPIRLEVSPASVIERRPPPRR